MKKNLSLHREAFTASPEAGVLFVDLDDTLLNGTASLMTDEEIMTAPLIQRTVNAIMRAKSLGIPVVMASRNSLNQLHRVLALRPDIDALFDDILSCLGLKSDPMNDWMGKKGIRSESALFIDNDTSELKDVEENVAGATLVDATDTGEIQFNKKEEKPTEIAEGFRYRTNRSLLLQAA